MALILGVEKNQDFFVGNTQVIVSDIYNDRSFRLTVIESDGESHFEIEDQRNQGIMFKMEYSPETRSLVPTPYVFVQAGSRGSPTLARVAISAPRSVEILRGDLYRNSGRDGYSISSTARRDMRELGLKEDLQVLQMVTDSAKVTHPKGNRRFEAYVFKMDGRVISGIAKFALQEGIVSEGKIPAYDDCPKCDGHGCGSCDGGQLVVGYYDSSKGNRK